MDRSFNQVTGYVSLRGIDVDKLKNKIEIISNIIKNYYHPQSDDKILVAGCGDGVEAAILSEEFSLFTIGVDISLEEAFITKSSKFQLKQQDLMNLTFDDEIFYLVYCYHVLEHVNDHLRVLHEIHRVMKTNGILYIGFPNKNRIIGYIGLHNKANMRDVFLWNFNDLKHRLVGKFENQLGAHAGFTQKEFLKDSMQIFREVHPVRNNYMLLKYPKYSPLLKLIMNLGAEEFVFPSNYYICKK